MSASLTLTGMRELLTQMEQLPVGLEAAAGTVVRASAYGAANELRSALALGPTGNLRRGVRVERLDVSRYRVISGAPHAFINEEGTGPRQTKGGANRGRSPASKTVARVASDQRRAMNGELQRVFLQVLGRLR